MKRIFSAGCPYGAGGYIYIYIYIYGRVYLAPIHRVLWEWDFDVGRILRYNCEEGEDVILLAT